MMVYAESSAVLAWLLGERNGTGVRAALAEAQTILSSELTLVECDRVLIRATASGELPEAEAASRRSILNSAAANWVLLRMDSEVVERARRPFPAEPIRTLDAIQLASALAARGAVPQLELLSLDQRIRKNARLLGFELLPRK